MSTEEISSNASRFRVRVLGKFLIFLELHIFRIGVFCVVASLLRKSGRVYAGNWWEVESIVSDIDND